MKGLGHGQIWWADLDKIRPVLILTRSSVAPLLHRVVVAPITTVVRDIPVEVPLQAENGVADGSIANFDNIQLIPVTALLRQAGAVRDIQWDDCCRAMQHMMACN